MKIVKKKTVLKEKNKTEIEKNADAFTKRASKSLNAFLGYTKRVRDNGKRER